MLSPYREKHSSVVADDKNNRDAATHGQKKLRESDECKPTKKKTEKQVLYLEVIMDGIFPGGVKKWRNYYFL